MQDLSIQARWMHYSALVATGAVLLEEGSNEGILHSDHEKPLLWTNM